MKNRTKFLIKCGEVIADRQKFEEKFDCYENLGYFCNVASLLSYNKRKDSFLSHGEAAMNIFNDLYKDTAENQLSSFKLYNSGFFGSHYVEEYKNHRLMAIAFAAAVSETEK